MKYAYPLYEKDLVENFQRKYDQIYVIEADTNFLKSAKINNKKNTECKLLSYFD